jgi:hypothetical protein
MKKWEIDRIKRAIQSCKNKIKHHHEHTRSKVSNAIKNEYAKIDALEKQIPTIVVKKNPICYSKSKDGEELYAYEYYCPKCDKRVYPEEHHCPCGQALAWSESEKEGSEE